MELQGKNVVVTGAGRGIGEALARAFHAEGARLVIADLQGAGAVAASLDGVVGIDADVSTEEGNKALIDAATDVLGPIDLFFANAGVGMGTGVVETDEEAWATSFAVNVNAHRWAAKQLLPMWLERGEGYFCSTASAAGLLIQIGSGPYTVSKRAAVAFAEFLAITYGDQGIKVTCLCPQGVNTAMLHAGDDAFSGGNVVKAAAAVLEPEQVADDVVEAIRDERFFVLPHPEVADYMQLKASDPERWLGGMRKLQRRVPRRVTTAMHRSPATLARLGLRLGEPIRFRRNDKGRWVVGRVVGIAADGSVTLRDPDGSARSLRAERVEIRRPGSRGRLCWQLVSDVAITWQQLDLFPDDLP